MTVDRNESKTVRNALKLLGLFSTERPVLSIPEIARMMGLPRTNTVRLLATLESQHFIQHLPDGQYTIGFKAFEVGALYMARNPFRSLAAESLERLATESSCTAYFGELQQNEVIILNMREGSEVIRFIWQVGSRLPCTVTSIGKAILSVLPANSLNDLVPPDAGLPHLTENSIATRQRLLEDIEKAAKRGWACSRSESYVGIASVGAPVYNSKRTRIFGLSLSFLDGPEPARFEELGKLVASEAEKLSRSLDIYGQHGLTS